MDTIICQGFTYDCSLGFHANEKGITQKIVVDVEVPVVGAGSKPAHDSELLMRAGLEPAPTFDYFIANQLISEFLKTKHFNLIETVGQGVAELLLEKFDVPSVKVSVTKRPLDMPNVGCVKYVCERCRGDSM